MVLAEVLKYYGGADFISENFGRFHHDIHWAYPGNVHFILGGQGRYPGRNKQIIAGRFFNGLQIKNV